MSFFFTKKTAEKPKGPVSFKPTQANKSSKESMNRLGCRVCPLDKATNVSPKMEPILAESTDIYILGEQPSKAADKQGDPFAGKVQQLLDAVLDNDVRYSYDNVIRDHDSRKLVASWHAMECCRSLVTKSIEHAKPKLLLGLGILPLQWVLNSADMVGLRGRVFAITVGSHQCWFMPTYHPEYIIENAYEGQEPLRSKLGNCLKFDVAKATKLARTLPPPQIVTAKAARAGVQAFDGLGVWPVARLLGLISEARRAPEKAIDIETSTLRPYAADAKVLTVALSFGDVNFSFAMDHPKAGWKPDEKAAIKKALKALLTDETTIIAHNAPFEIEWLVGLLGKDAIRHENWECTMMQAHFLDERRGKRGGNDDQFQPNPYQALDFLVKQYFGLAYKALFNLNRKDMAKADLGETLLYNGADTKFTLQLYAHQKDHLQQAGLLSAYRGAKLRQPSVALMQAIGIDVDQAEVKAIQSKLEKEIATVESSIQSYSEVKDFIRERKSFNPASTPDVLKLLKEYIRAGSSLVNSDGKESVDKGVLEKLDHPIGKDLELYRNRSKLKSTYVDVFEYGKGSFIWPDRKIHPSFNTTFAETGRTSSSEPNQQNWPSRNDKWVRKQVAALPGYILLAFDYGQLEACTAAMCTKDRVLVQALWDDYDIHMAWAIKAANRHPGSIGGLSNLNDPKVMKKFRSIVKNKLVFPAMFGASNKSVAEYLSMPIEPVNKLMEEFWATFSGIHRWQKAVMRDYYDKGFVESPTGRRRHYPLSKNQAVNYPIQSVACDIVCDAMVRLSRDAADTGCWYLHPIMNIHDDLTFCVPDNPQILEEAIEHIYTTMLTPAYKFINVPLSVSCSVGKNWLEMDDVGKFWSHKDV